MKSITRDDTDYIVVHCSATSASKDIGANDIRVQHKLRGWKDIGYHFVIRRNGAIELGREISVVGAHVKGYNKNSVAICMVGGSTDDCNEGEQNFNISQYYSLRTLIKMLKSLYTSAVVVGHRDLSPDIDGDGKITRKEWLKECPSFDINEIYTNQYY